MNLPALPALHPYVLGYVVALVAAMALFALYAVYAERKLSAFMQDRLGPMEVGPHGLLQTLADILKLIQKETIVHATASRWLFLFAPLLVFVSVFAGFAFVPLAPGLVGSAAGAGVLFLLALVSVDVVGLLMAGWASNNKYALLGSFRAVAQIISYEIPAGLSILAVVMLFGTLSLSDITLQQGVLSPRPTYFLGLWDVTAHGGIFSWAIFQYPHLIVVFIIFFVAGLAEANRAPFDIPEAESELVSGFHTEYSGFRFAVLMLAEYGMMLLVALVATTLFLGGWNTPLPNLIALPEGVQPGDLSPWQMLTGLQLGYLTTGMPGSPGGIFWGMFWTLSKSFALVGVMMWLRWTLPRLRADQLLVLCWKYLTPIAFVCILLSALWKAF